MRRRPFHKGLSQQAAQKRTVHLHHVWKIQIEHIADRLFLHWVISTDVENAVAAQKIQIRLIIHVEEICAFGARIDLVETDDALRCHERAVYVPLVQLVVFAETRGDNLLQIESHEEENLSDSRSKRKSCSHAFVRRQRRFSCDGAPGRTYKKKLQDSERILQLNFANSASLIVRLEHAQLCGAQLGRCNKHEPFGRIAMALSQPCQLRQQCSLPCRERNLQGPARPSRRSSYQVHR